MAQTCGQIQHLTEKKLCMRQLTDGDDRQGPERHWTRTRKTLRQASNEPAHVGGSTHTHTHRKGEASGNLLIMRTRKMAKGTMARTAKINASRI